MKTIHQFEIRKRGPTVLSVPKGTQFLQALALRDSIALFAIIDTIAPAKDVERRVVHPFFTGYDLPESTDAIEFRYLGTAVLNNEAPVHLFEQVVVDDTSEPEVKK